MSPSVLVSPSVLLQVREMQGCEEFGHLSPRLLGWVRLHHVRREAVCMEGSLQGTVDTRMVREEVMVLPAGQIHRVGTRERKVVQVLVVMW